MKKLFILIAVTFSINATELLKSFDKTMALKNSDEKYAKLYELDSKIAALTDYTFYYQGKINPKGFGGSSPGKFEKFVMKNKERFKSGSEGAYAIKANDFWIKKIKNKTHPIVGTYEFSKIYEFDMAVWEDADGSMHIDKLTSDYKKWMKKFPKHKKHREAKERIGFMKHWLQNNK